MSYALIIDTSIQGVSVGLGNLNNPDSLAVKCNTDNFKSSAALPVLIAEVLSEAMVTKADLSALVVAVGPGSFTGIKIGLSFCFGLMKARQQPYFKTLNVSSLREFAIELHRQQKHELAVLAPLTQDFGFKVDIDARGVSHMCALNLNTDVSANLSPRPMYAVKPWPKVFQLLKQRQLVWEEPDIAWVAKTTLNGIWRHAYSQWPANFTNHGLPLPNYLRKTTAEEHLDSLQAEKGRYS